MHAAIACLIQKLEPAFMPDCFVGNSDKGIITIRMPCCAGHMVHNHLTHASCIYEVVARWLNTIIANTLLLNAGTTDHAELRWHQPDRQPACLSAGIIHSVKSVLW